MFATEATARALIAVEGLTADAADALNAITAYGGDEIWPLTLLAQARYALTQSRPHKTLELVTVATSPHRIAPNSLAEDIATALQTDALVALGEVRSARQFARRGGHLTTLSRARLALRAGDAHAAAMTATTLIGAADTPAAVRAEATLLRLWVTVSATDNCHTRWHLPLPATQPTAACGACSPPCPRTSSPPSPTHYPATRPHNSPAQCTDSPSLNPCTP